jgi:uncharacterized protein DUF2852
MTADALLRRIDDQTAATVSDRTRNPRMRVLVAGGPGLAVRQSGSAIMWCCGFGHAGPREQVSPRMPAGSAEPRWRGNAAFDEYRAETLRRLEAEQREFADFLAHLRDAKDKAEFDAFMAERRARPQPPSERP